MLRNIHAAAKNIWLNTIDANIQLFCDKSMTEKLALLEQFATQVNGIGKESIMETYLLWIQYI